MGKSLTTDDLVKTLKRRAMLPTDSAAFSKQDFIDILNEEMDNGLISFLMGTHEEYLVKWKEIDINPSAHVYEMPSRAIGNKLRGLFLMSTTGIAYELTRVDLKDSIFFQNDFAMTYYSLSFKVEDNHLVLGQNVPNTASKIRMYYYSRPGVLVENKYGAIIQSINNVTGEIQVDKIPTTFNANKTMDFTQAKSPNNLLDYGKSPINLDVNTKIITFSPSDIPSTLAVGDYITLENESIVPQLPLELHPLLAQRAAVACLEAINDTNGVEVARGKLAEIQQNVIDLIDNRTETNIEKISNTHSPLRQAMRKYRRTY